MNINEDISKFIGKKCGSWTVVKFVKMDHNSSRIYKCVCDCGTIKSNNLSRIRYGRSKSCGCNWIKNFKTTMGVKFGDKKPTFRLPPGESAFNILYYTYKRNSIKRKYNFKLTREEFKELTKGNCYFCGVEPSFVHQPIGTNGGYVYNGIDRYNNNAGYTKGNSVTCCADCNRAKGSLTAKIFMHKVLADRKSVV